MISEKLKIIKRESCRVCDSTMLKPLYSIGEQYINNFIEKDEIKKCIKYDSDNEYYNSQFKKINNRK